MMITIMHDDAILFRSFMQGKWDKNRGKVGGRRRNGSKLILTYHKTYETQDIH